MSNAWALHKRGPQRKAFRESELAKQKISYERQLAGNQPESKPYNAFEHLCRSIIPNQNGKRLMAMFTVYFDESGTHSESKAVVVAGYIATVEQWDEFEREWRAMLDAEHLTMFHRKDLENFRGEFQEKYGWDPTRRERVVKLAQGIIKRRVNVGFCSAVLKRDYDEIVTGEMRKYYGRHYYTFCINDALRLVSNWIRKFSRTDPIHYVFEAGAEGRGEVDARFEEINSDEKLRDLYKLASWTFADKRNLVQLQAADVIAYETFKQMDNRIVEGAKRKVRKSLEDLLKSTHMSNYWDKENLMKIVSHYRKRNKGQ